MPDQLSASALAGVTVVVTRPSGTAASLLTRARAMGASAIALPGLSLRETGDAVGAQVLLRAARDAHAWIFTSPSAVRYAFRLSPGLVIRRDACAFGVGAGTQRALAGHGIHAQVPTERSDSEALLAMPELASLSGQHIALVGAPGGRQLIADALRHRGARVDVIHVYERRPPRLTRRHFDALARASGPLIMLVSSAEALNNIVALLPAQLLTRLRHQILVVSSVRLAMIADEHGFEDVHMAASASPDDLLNATGKALVRHRL